MLVYAIAVFCQITVLLHYLGCGWLFVGSDKFIGYEKDHVPWTIANEDFLGMREIDLIIFANYWVCTVITTVGYGDYTGSTSIEYLFSNGIGFLGFVIFSVFQIAVL